MTICLKKVDIFQNLENYSFLTFFPSTLDLVCTLLSNSSPPPSFSTTFSYSTCENSHKWNGGHNEEKVEKRKTELREKTYHIFLNSLGLTPSTFLKSLEK